MEMDRSYVILGLNVYEKGTLTGGNLQCYEISAKHAVNKHLSASAAASVLLVRFISIRPSVLGLRITSPVWPR